MGGTSFKKFPPFVLIRSYPFLSVLIRSYPFSSLSPDSGLCFMASSMLRLLTWV